MNKKFISTVLAALMIAGSTSFTTFAAMNKGTVVIGNKAFDLGYANDPLNANEITNALVTGGDVYVKDFSGEWIDNNNGETVAASLIPAVVYKSATGTVIFDAHDTDTGSTVPDIIAPVLNKVSFTIGQPIIANKDANGDYKVSLAGLNSTDMFTTLTLNASEKTTIEINFMGVSQAVTTNDSGEVTINVADLLGTYDPQKNGISVATLKNILASVGGTAKVNGTLTDTSGNIKTIIITISAN
ncbi:MAG TPA: hypothetical protein VIM70_07515 [Clostridium sp.]|uniref:hypothetical protein n=1 Tax=Clostridium sp. TaxID=1506 RepID=UPI002F94FC96